MVYAVHEVYTYDLYDAHGGHSAHGDHEIRSKPVTTDFGKDATGANDYVTHSRINSTTTCFVNPQQLTQVRLDVGFTKWKWVITTLFGILPVFAILLVLLHPVYHLMPAWSTVVDAARDICSGEQDKSYQLGPPPPYEE